MKSKLEGDMLSFGTRKTHVDELSEYELLEEEAFALLESILDHGNDERMARSKTTRVNTQHEEEGAFVLLDEISDCSEEIREFEKESFVFLDITSQDDEVDNSVYQYQSIDPLELEKLEEEAFALLGTILDDDIEAIDGDVLFPARKSLVMDLQEVQNLVILEVSYSR